MALHLDTLPCDHLTGPGNHATIQTYHNVFDYIPLYFFFFFLPIPPLSSPLATIRWFLFLQVWFCFVLAWLSYECCFQVRMLTIKFHLSVERSAHRTLAIKGTLDIMNPFIL